MSFGLQNAAQTFQRFIDEVLRDMDFCYVLVASTWEEEHEQPLRFSEYVVLLIPVNCVFCATDVTFLGNTVSAGGESFGVKSFSSACPGQSSLTFPWHAQFLPAIHTTSRHH